MIKTTPGGGREETVDSTSSDDWWAGERWRQIKETKRSWACKEEEMKHSIETERKMKVQEGRRETVGAERPPLVQCWAHVSCKNPILQTWQIVLPWEQQWGYCEERESEEVKERERETGKGQACSSNHLLLQLTLALRSTCLWKGMYEWLEWSPTMRDAANRGRTPSHGSELQHLLYLCSVTAAVHTVYTCIYRPVDHPEVVIWANSFIKNVSLGIW